MRERVAAMLAARGMTTVGQAETLQLALVRAGTGVAVVSALGASRPQA